ncbi:MAG: glycosyltransferase family 39 protein, partial [Candidatus Sumerlaeaceae bacterium]|nr:glycosyltransferase family 39 protein [Candidatus Sumerlaeaceae bacterium]
MAPRKPHSFRRSLVLLLVAASALLRIYQLDAIPPALFRDEAEKVYNAFCLASTAHDCSGKLLPLFIDVFGVTTSAIYQYAAVPFVWILGVGEWAARLPAAFVGTLTIWLTFLAAERLWGTRAAFWSALFLAFSPWHIVFSRWAQQGIFLPLWLSLALYCWALFLGRRTWAVLGSGVALGLAFYTYDVARAFVPLLVILLCTLYYRELRLQWRATIAAAGALLVVALPTLYLLFFHTGA